MRSETRSIWLVLIVLAAAIGTGGAEGDLDSLVFKYEVRIEAMQKPDQALRERYKQRLAELQKMYSEAGDLDKTLAARAAAEADDPEADLPDGSPRELFEARRLFLSQRDAVQRQREKTSQTLKREFRKQLATLHKKLTAAGETDKAEAVRAEMAKLLSALQIDFEMEGGEAWGQATQSGWTSWALGRKAAKTVTKKFGEIGITITANGRGRLEGRGGEGADPGGGAVLRKGMLRSIAIEGTSWNDMVEDAISSRGGDGTITLAFAGLDSSASYTLTCWHNDSFAKDAGYAGGDYDVLAEITVGTLIGSVDKGHATNRKQGQQLSDADFDTTVIKFRPSSIGEASVHLKGGSPKGYLPVNGLRLTGG